MTSITITYKKTSTSTSSDEVISYTYANGVLPTIAGDLFQNSILNIDYWTDSNNNKYEVGNVYEGSSNLTLIAHWNLCNQGTIIWKNVVTSAGTEDIDISDVFVSAKAVFGKNQPFPYVEFKIRKNDFLSDTYWTERASAGFGHKPTNLNFTQDETIFNINLYRVRNTGTTPSYSLSGNYVFKELEDDGDTYYTLTCFHPAVKLKTVQIRDLFPFTISNDGTTVTMLGGTYTLTNPNTNHPSVNIYYSGTSYPMGFIFDYTDPDHPFIDYVYGIYYNVIRGIMKGAGFTSCSVSHGYSYFSNLTTDLSTLDIKDSYTESELATFKSGTKYQFPKVTIYVRPDENAWDVLQAIAKFANYKVLFFSVPYFQQMDVVNDSNDITIDYGVSGTPSKYNPELLEVSCNEDQGSEYILTAQTVKAESYETKVSVSGVSSSNSGTEIKTPFMEKVTYNSSTNEYTFDTTIRNKLCKLIALNELVRWYKPGDCIKYTTSELVKPTVYTSLPETVVNNQVICVSQPSIWTDLYYVGNNGSWVQISDSQMKYERGEYFAPTVTVRSITDQQNNITINNATLAQTTLYYPEGITEYIWGEPKFMDSQEQMSTVESITKDTVRANTADVSISNNYGAKIVVGNQSLSELEDDRSGFTGLILEKNWNAELYRLAGYYDGKVQAEFNTQGKISAGGGLVVLDDSGMRIISSNSTSDVDALRFKEGTDTYVVGSLYTSQKKLFEEFDDSILISPKRYDFAFSTNTKSIYAYSGNVTTKGTVTLSNMTAVGTLSDYDPISSMTSSVKFKLTSSSTSTGTITIPINNGIALYDARMGIKLSFVSGTTNYNRHITINVKFLGVDSSLICSSVFDFTYPGAQATYTTLPLELVDAQTITSTSKLGSIVITYEPTMYNTYSGADTGSTMCITFGVGNLSVIDLDQYEYALFSKFGDSGSDVYSYLTPYIYATKRKYYTQPTISNSSALILKACDVELQAMDLTLSAPDITLGELYQNILCNASITFQYGDVVFSSFTTNDADVHGIVDVYPQVSTSTTTYTIPTIKFHYNNSESLTGITSLLAEDATSLSISNGGGNNGRVRAGVNTTGGYIDVIRYAGGFTFRILPGGNAEAYQTRIIGNTSSSNTYQYVNFLDGAGTRIGVIGSMISKDTSGVSTVQRGVYLQAGNQGSLGLYTNGTSAWTSAPTPATSDNSTKIATTQWAINKFRCGWLNASGQSYSGDGTTGTPTWGVMNNGTFSNVFGLSTSTGGAVVFGDKSGQTSLQIDGHFYQDEGRKKVLDKSNVQCGKYTGSSTAVTVSFSTSFPSVPRVVVTPECSKSSPDNPADGWTIYDVTETGFKAIHSSGIITGWNWIAVSQDMNGAEGE